MSTFLAEAKALARPSPSHSRRGRRRGMSTVVYAAAMSGRTRAAKSRRKREGEKRKRWKRQIFSSLCPHPMKRRSPSLFSFDPHPLSLLDTHTHKHRHTLPSAVRWCRRPAGPRYREKESEERRMRFFPRFLNGRLLHPTQTQTHRHTHTHTYTHTHTHALLTQRSVSDAAVVLELRHNAGDERQLLQLLHLLHRCGPFRQSQRRRARKR